MLTGSKFSIYLDPESNTIFQAVLQKRGGKASVVLQDIIKEWAKDRGIEVVVTIELKGIDDATDILHPRP